jgi:hypothetical protein
MDTSTLQLPSEFVLSGITWTWNDLLYGLESGLIAPQVAVDAAVALLCREGEPIAGVVDLAGCSPEDGDILDYVRDLAKRECDDGKGRERWLYLILLWVFENRHAFADPLEMVEQIYADFGYPESVAGLVRYMPSDEPDLGSQKLNEDRLYKKWRTFLNAEAARLMGQS